MLTGLPGLLQPWGILLIGIVAALSFYLAYRWRRRVPGRSRLHLDVAAIALLALLTGGFFWRPLTEGGVFMPAGGGDLASFYYPTYSYIVRQLQGGNLPLWNPHVFSGMPLAADVQSGLFYPLNWPVFFSSLDYGTLEWLLIAHYWLASVFTYLLLRDIGLRRLGAIAGAVVFAFCGFMTAHLGHMPMVLVATWIPLILLLLRRALLDETRTGWVWTILAGLTAALSLLAGHVQIFAYGLLTAGLLWLYLFATRQRPHTLRSALPWIVKGGLLLAIALSIGAAQLLPSLELSNLTSRSTVSYEEASEFPNQPVTWLNLLLPRVFGSSPTNYALGDWQTTENWGYTGVVTLALAAAGLLLRRNRMVGYFSLLVALAFIIMVGDLSIVGAWIYRFLPGFNKLRDSGRALVLLGLGLAGLAGFGLDALTTALSRQEPERRRVFWWLVGVSAFVAFVLALVMPGLYSQLIVDNSAQYGRIPGAINDLGMLVLWLGLLAGIGWAAYRQRISASTAGLFILVLLVLDIFSPNSRFNPTTTNILAGYEQHDARSTLYKQSQDETTNIPLRTDSDTDVQDIWQPSSALQSGLLYDTGGAFNPLKLERYDYLWDIAKRNPNTPLYDLTGAAFQVISPTTIYQNEAKWERIQKYPNLEIYRNKNALPRAYLVHESRIEPGRVDNIEALRRFDVDPRHTVILESGTPVTSTLPGSIEAALGGGPRTESVKAITYAPDVVELTVKATAPGWVVLTDAYHPGWQATLNNNPVTIEPAYYAYRAVKVDTGDHTIRMTFSPISWQIGRAISLISLAATFVALALLMMRRMKRAG